MKQASGGFRKPCLPHEQGLSLERRLEVEGAKLSSLDELWVRCEEGRGVWGRVEMLKGTASDLCGVQGLGVASTVGSGV